MDDQPLAGLRVLAVENLRPKGSLGIIDQLSCFCEERF